MGVQVLTYDATLVTENGHAYKWSGQTSLGTVLGVPISNANMTTLFTAMQADLVNQAEVGVAGTAGSLAAQRTARAAQG